MDWHKPLRLLAILPIVAVAACGSGSSSPQVASIPTAAAGGVSQQAPPADTPGSTPGDGEAAEGADGSRPVFRLDDSDARRTALINAWSKCLIDHGATQGQGRDVPGVAGPGRSDMIVVADPVPAAAKAACADLLPELPPETEAATNPHFHDQSLAYVGCMRKQGLWVELLNDHDLDWTFTEGHSVPEDQDQIEHACLLQAFGGD